MALDIPDSASEVETRAKTDVQRNLPGSNPFAIKNNVIAAMVVAFANRIFDFYIQLQKAINLSFPDSSEGEEAERWGAIYGVIRLAATTASGNAIVTGTATTSIPISTTMASDGSNLYTSTATVSIDAESFTVASITRSGTTATLTTDDAHNLANNVTPTISGADQTEYNLTDVAIIVTGTNTFTYQVSGSPTTPATGTILADFTRGIVPITSDDFGADLNLDAGSTLTLQSVIVGADSTLNVDFGTIGGGTDQETSDELKVRYLDAIQNPVAQFNVAQITKVSKAIAGVTRVFVEEVTPAIGQVTIYFMRDNDDDPIPSAAEVSEVDAAIQAIRPANTSADDVFTTAPTAVPTAFTFTVLSPDTTTMRSAIESSLAVFFEDETEVGVNIDEDAYRAAITNTIDTEAGVTTPIFTLSVPSGDVTIATGEIGTLGTVTFP